MMVLLSTHYRCALCGDQMIRDGGYRLEPGDTSAKWCCMHGYAPKCDNFGVWVRIPLVYVDVEQA